MNTVPQRFYRRLDGAGRPAVWVLAVTGAIGVVSAAIDISYYAAREDPDAAPTGLESASRTAGDAYGIAGLVCVVLFLIWFHRAHTNLRPLGREPRWSARWAAGRWFNPIVNLFFRPKQSANDVWLAGAADPEHAGEEPRVPAYVHWWWATLLATGPVLSVGVLLYDSSAYFNRTGPALVVDFVGHCLTIATALLAIRFVREVTRMQDERSASLSGAPLGLGTVPAP